MNTQDDLIAVWHHILSTNPSSSTISALLNVQQGELDWSYSIHGLATDEPETMVSTLIVCLSNKLADRKDLALHNTNDEWLNIWNMVSKNKDSWDDYTWKSCIGAICSENFYPTSQTVQQIILDSIPNHIWEKIPEDEMQKILKTGLLKGDPAFIEKLIKLGVDLSKPHLIEYSENLGSFGSKTHWTLMPGICVTKNTECIKLLLEAGAGTQDLKSVERIWNPKSNNPNGFKDYKKRLESAWDFFMSPETKKYIHKDSIISRSDKITAIELIIDYNLKNIKDESSQLTYKKNIISNAIELFIDNPLNHELLKRLAESSSFEDCFKPETSIKYGLSALNLIALKIPDYLKSFLAIPKIKNQKLENFTDLNGFRFCHYMLMSRYCEYANFHINDSLDITLSSLADPKFLLKMLRKVLALSKDGAFDIIAQNDIRSQSRLPLTGMRDAINGGLSNSHSLFKRIESSMDKLNREFTYDDQFEIIKMLGHFSMDYTGINNRGSKWSNDQLILILNASLDEGETRCKNSDVVALRTAMYLMDTISKTRGTISENTEDLASLLSRHPKVWESIVSLQTGENSKTWNRDVFEELQSINGGTDWNTIKCSGEAAVLKNKFQTSTSRPSASHVL